MSLRKKDTHAQFDARPEDRLKRLDHIAEDALEFARARCRERRECEQRRFPHTLNLGGVNRKRHTRSLVLLCHEVLQTLFNVLETRSM